MNALLLSLVLLGQGKVTAQVKVPYKEVGFEFYLRSLDNDQVLTLRNRSERSKRVRLYGVVLPEIGKGYNGAQADFEKLVGRKGYFYLEYEKRGPRRKQGDWLAYIWEDGRMLNLAMVEDGWATPDKEALSGKYGEWFQKALNEAKRLHEGIWFVAPGKQ